MIFEELHKNVFHVKNVFPTEMFLRVGDEFNPINNQAYITNNYCISYYHFILSFIVFIAAISAY